MDAVGLGWVATASLLGAGMFLVPMGRLADIRGRRRVFAWGLGVYAVASFLAMIAGVRAFVRLSPFFGGNLLLCARLVQGIGGAMVFGTGVAILTSVYPAEKKGFALGVNTAMVYLGLSLGPFIGGVLTQRFGWRAVFAVNLPLSLGALGLVVWGLKGEWAEARGEGFDLTGALIYAAGILLLLLGFSRLPGFSGFLMVICGIGALVAFGFLELRRENPVFPLRIFLGNPVFTFSNLAALLNYSATAAVGLLLSLYLQFVRGLSAQAAGLILVSQPVVMALFSPVAGRVSDRLEPRVLASLGMGISALGLFLFALLTERTGRMGVIAGLVLVGFGFALFSAPNTSAVMGAVEPRRYGVASATLGTMRLLGQMLSLGLALMLLGIFVGRVRLGPGSALGILHTVRVAFILFGALCGVGVFFSLARGRSRGSGAAPGKAPEG